MALSEKTKNALDKAVKYMKDNPEMVSFAFEWQWYQMKETFKKQFDALPRDKQLKLIARLNELENEGSGK